MRFLPCPAFPALACRGVVAALHQMGMHCVLLTGDNWRTARSIGDQVGPVQLARGVAPDCNMLLGWL